MVQIPRFPQFLDSDKFHRDILGRDADDLSDLLIGEILQPEEDDGPVEGDAGIQTHFPDPGVQRAVASEGSGTPPEVDKNLLEKVGDLFVVGREHIADGVDRPLVFPDHLFEFTFSHCLEEKYLPIRRSFAPKATQLCQIKKDPVIPSQAGTLKHAAPAEFPGYFFE